MDLLVLNRGHLNVEGFFDRGGSVYGSGIFSAVCNGHLTVHVLVGEILLVDTGDLIGNEHNFVNEREFHVTVPRLVNVQLLTHTVIVPVHTGQAPLVTQVLEWNFAALGPYDLALQLLGLVVLVDENDWNSLWVIDIFHDCLLCVGVDCLFAWFFHCRILTFGRK